MLMMKGDKLSTAFSTVAPEGMLGNVTVSWIKYQLELLNRWASLELKIIDDDGGEKLWNVDDAILSAIYLESKDNFF